MVNKLLYNTILSQTFSPCGGFLLVGNIYGDIAVYDLKKILYSFEGNAPETKPLYVFQATTDIQICSMITIEKYLVVGTQSEISGWDWNSITSSTHPKRNWAIQLPSTKDDLEKSDINSMFFNKEDGHLYAGCGDNKIYVYNIEESKLIRVLDAHDNYIHSIHNFNNMMVSASEDGTVKLWDLKQKNPVNKIEPWKNSDLDRPELGKWIGAASINEDWLVCGGGPRLSMWHLRSLNMTSVFPIEDSGIHVAQFYDDRIMAGGASSKFYHLGYNADLIAELSTSASTIYSCTFQETPNKVLSLAGSSSKIDICTNFCYIDQTLNFFK